MCTLEQSKKKKTEGEGWQPVSGDELNGRREGRKRRRRKTKRERKKKRKRTKKKENETKARSR